MTKICSKCKEIKNIECYTKDLGQSSGLRPECKDCRKRREMLAGRIRYPEKLSIEYKRCTKCKKALLKNNFRKDKTKKDGFYSSCNACLRKRIGAQKKLNGDKYIDSTGYVKHVAKYKGGGREHRFIMERILGRKLTPKEVVHHINFNKKDNRPENLQLFSSHSEHMKLHYKNRLIPLKNNKMIDKICIICNIKFLSKGGLSKYCSPTCVYKSRIKYFNQWQQNNKRHQKGFNN